MSSTKKVTGCNVKACANNCGTMGAKLKCAKCKAAKYCSKACQKQHWKNGHKEMCFTPEERRPQATVSRESGENSRIQYEAEEEGCGSGMCPICLDSLSSFAVCTLPCNHAFHQECVRQLRKHGVQQVCPLCRVDLPAGPEKLFEDAVRLYIALCCQVGGEDSVLWQSLTNSQQQKMDTVTGMLTNAANQGHAAAQCELGCMYTLGHGVVQDNKKAMQWYYKGADQGYAAAQYSLGFMYENGKGVARDHKEAVQWYRKAADLGDDSAQCNLGTMFEHGKGVAQDFKKAGQWYRKAADQGNANAQCNLGLMYDNGQGVAQDFKKAVQWYHKAADKEHSRAQFNLGQMYDNGRGVALDHHQAVKWFRKAAELGNVDAQFNLGCMYRHGHGVAQDFEKAMQWCRKAASQGHIGALSILRGFLSN